MLLAMRLCGRGLCASRWRGNTVTTTITIRNKICRTQERPPSAISRFPKSVCYVRIVTSLNLNSPPQHVLTSYSAVSVPALVSQQTPSVEGIGRFFSTFPRRISHRRGHDRHSAWPRAQALVGMYEASDLGIRATRRRGPRLVVASRLARCSGCMTRKKGIRHGGTPLTFHRRDAVNYRRAQRGFGPRGVLASGA
ncbi:hypothetical protein Purlil1_4803 [Purpureocillium lilacinum]|uniref:Secreted protein n=1 Tax=Purpureocillium lilacinum TaxID=33203 RepID=A0ABR0C306_PURLI|nr:hypothetical protein Purlil1_4803 [Purpureocillium lilacinum]